MKRSRSYMAIPPGASIKEQLTDRGMSQKEFAARMDMSEKHISRLINGEVQLTPDVAVRLEVVLGVPARFWNNLEALYREELVKVETENSMEEDEALAKRLPYLEMAKLGWVPETRDEKEKVNHLRRYFELVHLSSLENKRVTRIACRRLAITEKADLALIAWVQEARLLSRQIETGPININRLKSDIQKIRKMTAIEPEEFCPELKKMLADCGIALVFLPHLEGSFLQGASFMEGNKIVLGMTVRGKDADKFWFSLFHELGHIILGHVGCTEELTEENEKEANNWSKDNLIPMERFEEFLNRNRFTRDSVREFAKSIGIAPGIVVGRLQTEGCISYSTLNELKEQYMIAQ